MMVISMVSLPRTHMPDILYDSDIHDYLAAGVKRLALNELDGGIRLVYSREMVLGAQ